MIKKVCVVTGSRAEYGLLRGVMDGIRISDQLALQLLVTGAHLSSDFGETYREIEADGFRIDRKIDLRLDGDSDQSVANAMALALTGVCSALQELRPDIVLVLGDRYEIFAAAAAAMVCRIPIAHLHGGEVTEGAIDEAIRHSVTKMSHLHFVATREYERRVIQLGETPERVYLVGGLGVDAMLRVPRLSKDELQSSLNFRFLPRNLLVTYHPVTIESESTEFQIAELLGALDSLEETGLIFTMPNADQGGLEMALQIRQFVDRHPNARFFPSLGQCRYFSCIAQVDGVVGNSSSGLLEVPSLGRGTVNIGTRQQGRLSAASVINCGTSRGEILEAIKHLYSESFKTELKSVINPYGEGGASKKIVRVLENCELAHILKKSFHDLSQ